jgi:hypothetical protein
MEDVTLPRTDWAAVARQLDSTSLGLAPSGLRSRIARLLADVPTIWGEEPCTLDLDAQSAAIVRAIVRRGRGLPADPTRAREQAAGLAEAEDIISDHQTQAAGPTYRIEHRTDDVVTVLGHTTASHARQSDLSEHASRLMATGATGELVLVDETTGEDVARRRLLASLDDESDHSDAN